MATPNDFGWYIATDNGVAVNSSADQSTSINSLIAAVISAGGGLIYFETGTYMLGAPVKILSSGSASLAIVGAGWGVGATVNPPGTFGQTGGTTFQTNYPFLAGSSNVFNIDTAAGGGLYLGKFAVDRAFQLQQNSTYVTATTGPIVIPMQRVTISVPVNSSMGAAIPNGSFVRISGSGHILNGYLVSGAGTNTWMIENTNEDSHYGATIAAGATVYMQGPTSGATFSVTRANNVRLDTVYTTSDFDTLALGEVGVQGWSHVYITNCISDPVIGSFAHILGGGSDFSVKNCYVRGLNAGSYRIGTNVACHVDTSSASDVVTKLDWDAVDIEAFAIGVLFQSSTGTFAESAFENITIDGATGTGAIVLQSMGVDAIVQDIRIDSGWATCDPTISATGSAVILDAGGNAGKVSGVNISAIKLSGNNSGSAVSIANGASNVTVKGCEIFGSGAGVSVSGSGGSHLVVSGNNLGPLDSLNQDQNAVGVSLSPATGGTVSNVVVSGNQLGYNSNAAVLVDALNGTCSDVAITGNSMFGYTPASPAVVQHGTIGGLSGLINVLASANPGFNPVGSSLSPTPPVVPASGTAITNPYVFPCRVYVSGGTGIVILITPANGGTLTSTGVTSGEVILGVGEQITIVFSSSPSWVWLGL